MKKVLRIAIVGGSQMQREWCLFDIARQESKKGNVERSWLNLDGKSQANGFIRCKDKTLYENVNTSIEDMASMIKFSHLLWKYDQIILVEPVYPGYINMLQHMLINSCVPNDLKVQRYGNQVA